MQRSLRLALPEFAPMATVALGLAVLAVAGDVYATHVTGVYQDHCNSGWYGAYAGPDHSHACYPSAFDGLYESAWAAVVLVALGAAASWTRSLRRLTRTPAWELGLRGLLLLLAAP